METTFDFKTAEFEYVRNITSNTKLCIKRNNHSVAILYFTDDMGNKITIPDGIVVYTTDYSQNNQRKVILNHIGNSYPLCWTDDYIVELNKNVLINIKNQRKWVIS
jgi:hypothetical protein